MTLAENSHWPQQLRNGIRHSAAALRESSGWLVIPTIVANAAILGLGLLGSILLSRWLGPTGRGEIAAAMLWGTLLIYICSMGLIPGTLYFASLPSARQGTIVVNAILFALVQGGFGMLAGFYALPTLLHSQPQMVIDSARAFLVVIPVGLLAQYLAAVLQARLMFGAVNGLRLVIPTGYLAGILLMHHSDGLTVHSIVVLQMWLNSGALLLIVATCVFTRVPVEWWPDRTLAARMLRYGVKVWLGDTSQIVNLRLDQALMSAWLSPAQLGLYVVAVSAAGLLEVLSLSWRMIAAPTIARESGATARVQALARHFKSYWRVAVLAALSLSAALPFVIPVVFGSRFGAATVPAEILLVGTLCLSAKNVLAVGLQALGAPWLASRAELVGLFVTIATLPPLLLQFGAKGAALASTLSYATQLAAVLYSLHRTHGLQPRALLLAGY
jgi:O-antigen/teichoic acid export membrane protein